jgi:Uma2 family endonuclease
MQSVGLTDDQFLRLCSDNRDFRIEMTARGELIVMPPPGSKTGQRNGEITRCLGNWTKQDGTGVYFELTVDHASGIAKRGPDAA